VIALADPAKVQLAGADFSSWAILDRRAGKIIGSASMAAPSDTMSMVKVWLVADYLRRFSGVPDLVTLAKLATMIRDSDNPTAEKIHGLNGGETRRSA
jgi:hypothetical protein